MKLRMTRRLDSGLMKVRDRKKNKKGEFESVFHLIGVKHSPVQKMVQKMSKERDPKDPKKSIMVPVEGQMSAAKDKLGFPLWSKYGESFEVNDGAYVLEHYKGIFEKC